VTAKNRGDELQRAVCAPNSTAVKCNSKISLNRVMAMAMKEKLNVRKNTLINNNVTEQ
jgi:hypothetical protein